MSKRIRISGYWNDEKSPMRIFNDYLCQIGYDGMEDESRNDEDIFYYFEDETELSFYNEDSNNEFTIIDWDYED